MNFESQAVLRWSLGGECIPRYVLHRDQPIISFVPTYNVESKMASLEDKRMVSFEGLFRINTFNMLCIRGIQSQFSRVVLEWFWSRFWAVVFAWFSPWFLQHIVGLWIHCVTVQHCPTRPVTISCLKYLKIVLIQSLLHSLVHWTSLGAPKRQPCRRQVENQPKRERRIHCKEVATRSHAYLSHRSF